MYYYNTIHKLINCCGQLVQVSFGEGNIWLQSGHAKHKIQYMLPYNDIYFEQCSHVLFTLFNIISLE